MNKIVHNDICVGIDLGTTNSLVATCYCDVAGKLQTPTRKVSRYVDVTTGRQKMRENRELLPSYVFYYDLKDGNYDSYVGDFAKKQYATTPYLVAKSIKSQMGKPKIEGLQEGIPDKKPEDVAARIIHHLLNDLEGFYQEKIKDVVITVPANFDPAMREATLRAAEKAGVNVRKEDGVTFNDEEILLSEPEAVMYDLINQIQKGEYDLIIDFTEKRKVLVFDIGGGTLDITLHEVERSSESQNIYNIEALATNRYSNVAGDTFDRKIANKMYKKYVQYYERQSPEIAQRIRNDKFVLPNFMSYAEELKLEIANAHFDLKQRGRSLSNDKEFEYGGRMTNGYPSENAMTKEEFEECVKPLLGYQYVYDDYKRFDNITDDENIIYPILDVLKKAAKKMSVDNIKIDAVVLNGGMSRLYLIKERLDEFFGLNTIVVADPDKSVAQGAAVYHYYLHQDSSLMRKLHEKKKLQNIDSYDDSAIEKNGEITKMEGGIISGGHVLNESIYLGLKGGATRLLVGDGEQLPYNSGVMTGFKIEKGQNKIRIPIMYKTSKKGNFTAIASGDIEFKKTYDSDMPVSIKFSLSRNQILSFEAWTSLDDEGKILIEKGQVMLTFGFIEFQKSRAKMLPPTGTRLIPKNELSSIKDLCDQLDGFSKTHKNKARKAKIVDTLKRRKKNILYCGNPEDFSFDIINMLRMRPTKSFNFCFNLLPIARRLSKYWADLEKKELINICFDILRPELLELPIIFPSNGSTWTNIYIEAIKTIGYCGFADQTEKLNVLIKNTKYRSALLYAFANSKIKAYWIYQQFVAAPYITDSVWALGLVMQRNSKLTDVPKEELVVSKIVEKIDSGFLNKNELISAIITLSIICDQRSSAINPVSDDLVFMARNSIIGIEDRYYDEYVVNSKKARSIALQLLNGNALDENDEQHLLSLIDLE